MGTFTMHDDPRVDEKIRKDLENIVAEICATMSPVTILLTGSFGRGEGSVLIRDDQIVKVKDYDIVIIAGEESCLPLEKLWELRDRIETKCKFSALEDQYKLDNYHVGLPQFSTEQFFQKKHPIICDIKRASRVLYGKDLREELDLDLKKMALSHVYFSIHKEMKHLLNNFSIDYFTSPPEGMKRFHLIFLCCKVYNNFEMQLILCYNISHPSSPIGRKRLKDDFRHLYPELARDAPDLLERIRYASGLRLFPEAIEASSIDPVNMWFETQRDLDLVMRYCIKTLAHVDSDDWTVLSDRFYRLLCHDYHYYQIEHYLDKRLGTRAPVCLSLGNIIYRKYDTHRYIKGLFKKKEYRKIHPRLYTLSPVFKILAISPLLLFSLRNDGSVDRTLFTAFCKRHSFLFPNLEDKIPEPMADNWEYLKDMLLEEIRVGNRLLHP